MNQRIILTLIILALPNTLWASNQNSSMRLQAEIAGSYHVGISNNAHFEAAQPKFKPDTIELALPITFEWGDAFQLSALLSASTRLPFTLSEPGLDLPQIAAHWRFSTNWEVIAGRSLQPFGLQNELRYHSIKRQIALMPAGFYGFNNVVGTDYTGLGFKGRLELSKIKWGLDLYSGQSRIPTTRYFDNNPNYYVLRSGPRTIGGRLVTEFIESNLSMALSGKLDIRKDQSKPLDYALAASVMYHGSSLEIIFEALYARSLDNTTDFYLQVAYDIVPELTLLTRFDWLDILTQQSAGRNLRHHQEIVLGLMHQINEYCRTELTGHFLVGNRFARPNGYEIQSASIPSAKQWELQSEALMLGLIFSY